MRYPDRIKNQIYQIWTSHSHNTDCAKANQVLDKTNPLFCNIQDSIGTWHLLGWLIGWGLGSGFQGSSIEANWGRSMTDFRCGLENSMWQAYFVVNGWIPMDPMGLSTHWERVCFWAMMMYYPISHVCRGLHCNHQRYEKTPPHPINDCWICRSDTWSWSWINDTSKFQEKRSRVTSIAAPG